MSTEVVVAVVGIVGVCAGSVVSAACQYWFQERPRQKADEERKKLLKRMLENPKYKWRKFDRLMHVIGADDATTKRLLLEIGARASEDGLPVWGLIERNPFDEER
ncbi:MAG: hypothetical protein Q7S40_06430 [Opitutaceae bacterium]|nr:hypothetical protein [Opitutaceae bacterium]